MKKNEKDAHYILVLKKVMAMFTKLNEVYSTTSLLNRTLLGLC
jgi:hypothetical protein